jgi:rhodanese-related sulfurtransferase
VVLLDVREPEEWDVGYASGAVHRALSQLDPAGLDADRRYVAVCRSGNRSGQAAARMVEAGLDVANMAGGMSAWAEAGRPVVRDDGCAGTVS